MSFNQFRIGISGLMLFLSGSALSSHIILFEADGVELIVYENQAAFLAGTGATAADPWPDIGLVPSGTHTEGDLTVTFVPPRATELWIGEDPMGGPWSPRIPGFQIAISGWEEIDVDVGLPVLALGWDMVEPENDWDPARGDPFADSTFSVNVQNGSTTIASFEFNVDNDTAAFIGISSNTAFDRIEVREIAGSNDDEIFGQFYVNPAPDTCPAFSLAGSNSPSSAQLNGNGDECPVPAQVEIEPDLMFFRGPVGPTCVELRRFTVTNVGIVDVDIGVSFRGDDEFSLVDENLVPIPTVMRDESDPPPPDGPRFFLGVGESRTAWVRWGNFDPQQNDAAIFAIYDADSGLELADLRVDGSTLATFALFSGLVKIFDRLEDELVGKGFGFQFSMLRPIAGQAVKAYNDRKYDKVIKKLDNLIEQADKHLPVLASLAILLEVLEIQDEVAVCVDAPQPL